MLQNLLSAAVEIGAFRVNLFPCYFSEEWEWMKVIGSDNPVVPPSNNQQNFQNSLAKAAKKLFKHLGECHLYP